MGKCAALKRIQSSSENGDSNIEVEDPRPPKRVNRGSNSKAKNDTTEENLEAKQLELEKMRKKVAQLQAKLATKKSQATAKSLNDDDAESEEEQNPPSASTSIQALEPIHMSNMVKLSKLKRAAAAAPKATPRVKPNMFKSVTPSVNRESSPDEATNQPPTADNVPMSDDTFFGGAPSTETPLASCSTSTTQGHASSKLASTGQGQSSSKSATTTPSATATASDSASTATTAQPSGMDKDSALKEPGIRANANHNPKHPKASDYEDTVEALILCACLEYECRISTLDAFPDSAKRLKWAQKCWKNACVDVGESYRFTDTISTLIRERGSRIRSRGITKIRQRIETIFGFDHRKDERTITKNKKLCDQLRKDSAFQYKDFHAKAGYAQGWLVYESLQTIWFEKKDSHGIVFKDYFNPIRTESIALIFTITDFILEQWSTGTFNATAKMYETDVRDRHLTFRSHVKQWYDIKPETVKKMLTTLHDRARRDAGVTQATSAKSTLDDDALKRMREELEGRTGETDSEAEEEAADDEDAAAEADEELAGRGDDDS